MKCLKISSGKGLFSLNGQDYQEIDQITKEDLLKLLEIVISSETEMDTYCEETLQHPAHRIIYRNIYQKLSDLRVNRTRFKDESEALYRDAMDKYKAML